MQCKTPRSRGSCRRYVLNKGYRRSGTPAGCKAPRNIAGLCHHHAWGKANSLIQNMTAIWRLIATRLRANTPIGNC